MIDRKKFYDGVRGPLFGGSLTASQVAGSEVILNEWEKRKLSDLRWLAYMLGTTFWETNQTMAPVKEAYWLSENWRKQNLRYYPYYGRGFVQLTWRENYEKMGKLLGIDLSSSFEKLERAMELPIATQVLFEGMLRAESNVGDFTNHSLEMYFNETKEDWVGARRIINGTDKARDIAGVAKKFWTALPAAT